MVFFPSALLWGPLFCSDSQPSEGSPSPVARRPGSSAASVLCVTSWSASLSLPGLVLRAKALFSPCRPGNLQFPVTYPSPFSPARKTSWWCWGTWTCDTESDQSLTPPVGGSGLGGEGKDSFVRLNSSRRPSSVTGTWKPVTHVVGFVLPYHEKACSVDGTSAPSMGLTEQNPSAN